jgi:phosphatidylglycerol:prolipoprotein diacylglycerol transferase
MDGLPFIDIPQSFGPFKTFGLFLFCAVVLASWMGRKYCERNGLEDDTMRWLGIRLIIWGFVGSVALNIVFYEWSKFVVHPWDVFKQFGISSYGAIVSAAIAFFYYTRKRGLDRREWSDMAAWAVSGGWLLGRLGCAIAHDHVGLKTDSPLGVNFPPGRYPFEKSAEVIRAHDLGLYEFFLWIALTLMVIALERWKGRRPGFLLGILAVVYSVPRFLFEYLRMESTDPRYGGLTFAQWASIAAFLIGLWLLFGPRRPAAAATAAPEADEPAPASPRPSAKGARRGNGRRARGK